MKAAIVALIGAWLAAWLACFALAGLAILQRKHRRL